MHMYINMSTCTCNKITGISHLTGEFMHDQTNLMLANSHVHSKYKEFCLHNN